MKPREDFLKGLKNLRTRLITMAVLVTESIEKIGRALSEKNSDLVQQIISEDARIDEIEIQLDDQCVAIIAMENPVASDLRHIIATISISSEIERMGDHSVHVAKSILGIGGDVSGEIMEYINSMVEKCCAMSRELISVLTEDDEERARKLSVKDNEVDDLFGKVMKEIRKNGLNENETETMKALQLNYVAHYLERFADHITNCTEWIVYGKTGVRTELNA